MTYLGQVETDETVTEAEGWLRARWADFVNLFQPMLDVQHRAAVAVNEARQAGNEELAEQARSVVDNMAKLIELHAKVVEKLEAAGFGGQALGAFPLIPVAALGVSGLATLALWIFRKYEAEAEKLRLIEAGVLTPEQAAALDPGPPPGGMLGTLVGADWARWALIGLGLFLAWNAFREFQPNPPLVMLGNPPGDFGRHVYAVEYRHTDDGEPYRHDFGPGVRLRAEPDGSVRIYHPSRPVWADF